jgi:septal ring-binding cell division protein DamX
MSMTALAAMNKDWVLQEAESLKKYLLRGTPALPQAEEAASAGAAAMAASAASADALAAAEAEMAASVASEAAQAASQSEKIALTASAPSAETVLAPAVAVASAAPDSAVVASAQASTKNVDAAWVNDLPANGYVVQLAAMDTQDEMKSFQRSNAAYSKARVLRARHKDSGKRYFILVAGPFENKTQADAYMQSSPLLSKGWLRSTKSLKTQLSKS